MRGAHDGNINHFLIKGGKMKAPQSDFAIPEAFKERMNRLKLREATGDTLPGQDLFSEAPQKPLPDTPAPNAQVIQTAALPASGAINQGLTATENALLSEEEKQIRLRSRGLA